MPKELSSSQIKLLTDMAWHICMRKNETKMIASIIKKGTYDVVDKAVLNILRKRYLDALKDEGKKS